MLGKGALERECFENRLSRRTSLEWREERIRHRKSACHLGPLEMVSDEEEKGIFRPILRRPTLRELVLPSLAVALVPIKQFVDQQLLNTEELVDIPVLLFAFLSFSRSLAE